jgi:RNA polymerase-binding transcription factor DksA
MSKIDIDKKRIQLEERLESLQERLAEFSETLRQPEDDDFEEQAAELDEDEVVARLSRAGRTELQLIEAALKRIDEGTYGKCVDCGKTIEKRRLQALPEAERCLSCAQRMAGR